MVSGGIMKSVKDLKVYQLGFDLAINIYKVTACFPPNEHFGLVSQMRRAAVSICSNLAEGAARGTTKEYLRFVYVAKGSAAELEAQIDLAAALGFVKNNVADNLVKDVEEVLRMLSGLIHSLTTNTNH